MFEGVSAYSFKANNGGKLCFRLGGAGRNGGTVLFNKIKFCHIEKWVLKNYLPWVSNMLCMPLVYSQKSQQRM